MSGAPSVAVLGQGLMGRAHAQALITLFADGVAVAEVCDTMKGTP